MSRVTAMLLNYKRPEKLAMLIDALREQTEKPEVMVIDNSQQPSHRILPYIPLAFREVDRYVHIPWNAGCWIRLAFARYASTPWVMFMDDDVLPADDRFVEDALRIAREHPQVITGAYGRMLALGPPYYRNDAMGYVHIIKGRFMFFDKAILRKVSLSAYDCGRKHDPRFLEDIFFSLQVGGYYPVHWADLDLQKRIVEQSPDGRDGLGISEELGHPQRRDDFCRWYLKEIAL